MFIVNILDLCLENGNNDYRNVDKKIIIYQKTLSLKFIIKIFQNDEIYISYAKTSNRFQIFLFNILLESVYL